MFKTSIAAALSKTLAKAPQRTPDDNDITPLKGWTGQPAVPQELKK